MDRPRGRGFRIFISLLLVGIFLELFIIIGVLSDKRTDRGDIAVVEVHGIINEALPTVKKIKKYVENERVKAIVLRVDTPGGAVGTSQEIHDAVLEANKTKKVVVSMGDVAASGGYYVSAPAAKIVANPGTITGSIGVVAQFLVIEDLLKKAYLRWEVIKAGKVKDMGSPLRDLTPEERKILQGVTDDMHEQFIEAVAKGRKMTPEKVREVATGAIFSGKQAKELGLVDELGGLEKAIQVAAKLAGVEGEPKVIYPEREKFGWFKRMAEGKFETSGLKIEYRLRP